MSRVSWKLKFTQLTIFWFKQSLGLRRCSIAVFGSLEVNTSLHFCQIVVHRISSFVCGMTWRQNFLFFLLNFFYPTVVLVFFIQANIPSFCFWPDTALELFVLSSKILSSSCCSVFIIQANIPRVCFWYDTALLQVLARGFTAQ